MRLAVQSHHGSGTNLDQLGLSAADLKAIVSKNAIKLVPQRKAIDRLGR